MWSHGCQVVLMMATYSGHQQYVDTWKGNVVSRSGVLLGDSGYACTPFLMNPYAQPRTRSEGQFNRAHKTSRCIIERSFGLVKRRFHVLHSEIRRAPDRVCTIIVACIVLHNMAIHSREPELDDGLIVDEEYDLHEQYRGPENGIAVRRHITDTFF